MVKAGEVMNIDKERQREMYEQARNDLEKENTGLSLYSTTALKAELRRRKKNGYK